MRFNSASLSAFRSGFHTPNLKKEFIVQAKQLTAGVLPNLKNFKFVVQAE